MNEQQGESSILFRHGDKGKWQINEQELRERLPTDQADLVLLVLSEQFTDWKELPLQFEGVQRSIALADKLFSQMPDRALVLITDSGKDRAQLTRALVAERLYPADELVILVRPRIGSHLHRVFPPSLSRHLERHVFTFLIGSILIAPQEGHDRQSVRCITSFASRWYMRLSVAFPQAHFSARPITTPTATSIYPIHFRKPSLVGQKYVV